MPVSIEEHAARIAERFRRRGLPVAIDRHDDPDPDPADPDISMAGQICSIVTDAPAPRFPATIEAVWGVIKTIAVDEPDVRIMNVAVSPPGDRGEDGRHDRVARFGARRRARPVAR